MVWKTCTSFDMCFELMEFFNLQACKRTSYACAITFNHFLVLWVDSIIFCLSFLGLGNRYWLVLLFEIFPNTLPIHTFWKCFFFCMNNSYWNSIDDLVWTEITFYPFPFIFWDVHKNVAVNLYNNRSVHKNLTQINRN